MNINYYLVYFSFVRCLKRKDNSCSRCDVFYIPPPGSDMAKKREDKKKPLAVTQPSIAPPSTQVSSALNTSKLRPPLLICT